MKLLSSLIFFATFLFIGSAFPTFLTTAPSRHLHPSPITRHHAVEDRINSDDKTTTTSSGTGTAIISPSGADLNAWAKGHTTCPIELPPTILDIELPPDFPTGTYYRNGAGRYESDDGTKVLHPFDGDGMIVAMTFDPDQYPNRMLFRNKFVETEGYVKDKATGKMSGRGLFGTMKSGSIFQNMFDTAVKNVANTNVVHAGDALYALWEGGLPYKLNPLTLENVHGKGVHGETDLDGLTTTTNKFAAHLRYDPRQKSYVNFAVDFDPSVGSTITLFEVDQHTLRSSKPCSPSIISEYPGLIHDFILTENYCIFNINECSLNGKNALKALFGLAGFASSIDVDIQAKETSLVVIPRSLFDETEDIERNIGINYLEDDRIIVCKVPNHFNFHYGNAYEDESGCIVFDTAQTKKIDLGIMSSGTIPIWKRKGIFSVVEPNTLVRYTLDIKNRCLAKGMPPKTLSTRIPEFPTIPKELSTRKHKFLYPVASHLSMSSQTNNNIKSSGPAGAIQKVDTTFPELTETFSFESYEFPGEAVFATKKGRDITQPDQEDAGYLLVHVVNGRNLTTDLCIFDVEGKGSLENGPITRITLPVFLPHLLHGNFFDGVTFQFDEFV